MDNSQDSSFPISANSNFGIAEESDSQRSSTMSPDRISDTSSQEASKNKKAPAPTWAASGASAPGSPSHGSTTPNSTVSSSSSKFDAKSLLNPKGSSLSRLEKRSTPTADSNPGDEDDANGPGMSAMLEQFHGLKPREVAPNKRRKVNDPETDGEQAPQNATSERVDTGGQLGLALREEQRQLQESKPVQSSTVDLTGNAAFPTLISTGN